MKLLIFSFFLFAINISLPLQGQEAPDPPLQSLLSEKEFRKYQEKVKYKDRIDIYREALSDRASELRSRLNERKIDKVQESLRAIRALAHYGLEEPTREAASDKDRRSKEVKKLEIRIRRLVDTLHDLKLSVPYEYRADFEATIADLEKLRDQLLHQLFGS